MSTKDTRSWDLKNLILQKIKYNGGWVNAHAHFDRAFTITPETLIQGLSQLQDKWQLVNEIKKTSTTDQIYDRMCYAGEHMLKQGVTAVGTFVDVDEVVEDKAIKAATKFREKYKNDLQIKFMNQVVTGVLSKEARQWFEIGAEFVDIIGGLPGKDAPHEAEHLDVLLQTAKKMGKMVHAHVDQLNSAKYFETELLTDKTIEHGMEGKIVAVHSVSVGAHPIEYRQKLYKKMKQANVMVVSCPIAWIDATRSEELAPIHNAITPVDEMLEAGITVAIGTDNIADLYKPFAAGNMWEELHLLLEALKFYDIDSLVKIATVNGKKVLGLASSS